MLICLRGFRSALNKRLLWRHKLITALLGHRSLVLGPWSLLRGGKILYLPVGNIKRLYDFIIIGGGTAGSIIARRLVDNTSSKILLIEAGGDRNSVAFSNVPAQYPRTFGSRIDWDYKTVPQSNLGSRSVAWPRGKVWGGSSAINAQIYIRGFASDFDRWAESGCHSWDYKSVRPFFEKTILSPSFRGQNLQGEGLLNVERPRYLHPWTSAFLKACENDGLPIRENSFDEGQSNSLVGVHAYLRTTKLGKRQSTYDAFVESLCQHPRLDRISNAIVDRFTLNQDRVVSVIIRQADSTTEQVIRCSNQVILSAGTVGTPCILQRSGIGPKSVLEKAGIDVRLESPGIGSNLQDHLIFPVIFRSAREQNGLPAHFTDMQETQFRLLGSGPMASNLAEAGGFFYSDKSLSETSDPDLQFHFTPTHYLEYSVRPQPTSAMTLGITVLRPRSRGIVQIQSADPTISPLLDPQYFSEPCDSDLLVKGVEIARRIATVEPLAGCIAEEILPGAKRTSVDQLNRSIRAYCQTLYHPVGSCAMGSSDHHPVDICLKLKGVENLMVADASVMPDLPSGNTQAAVMMIAERASRWLI